MKSLIPFRAIGVAVPLVASLHLLGGSDSQVLVFSEPVARTWTYDKVKALLGRFRSADALGRQEALGELLSVNRRDHPWVMAELMDHLSQATRSDDAEARLWAEAISWYGGRREMDQYREILSINTQLNLPGLPSCIWLVQQFADEQDYEILLGMASASSSPTGRESALVAIEDLFGSTHEKQSQVQVLPGSTSWMRSRLDACRQWVLSQDEYQERKRLIRRAIWECPEGGRPDFLELILKSRNLPLEEFPGRAELSNAGGRIELPRHWRASSDGEMLGVLFDSSFEEVYAILCSGDPIHVTSLWEMLVDRKKSRLESSVPQLLYDAALELQEEEGIEFERARFLALAWLSECGDVHRRDPAELRFIRELSFERWFVQDELRTHYILRRLEFNLPEEYKSIHKLHWLVDPCPGFGPEEIAVLRSRLQHADTELEWSRAKGRFVRKESD